MPWRTRLRPLDPPLPYVVLGLNDRDVFLWVVEDNFIKRIPLRDLVESEYFPHVGDATSIMAEVAWEHQVYIRCVVRRKLFVPNDVQSGTDWPMERELEDRPGLPVPFRSGAAEQVQASFKEGSGADPVFLLDMHAESRAHRLLCFFCDHRFTSGYVSPRVWGVEGPSPALLGDVCDECITGGVVRMWHLQADREARVGLSGARKQTLSERLILAPTYRDLRQQRWLREISFGLGMPLQTNVAAAG